jgi:isoquinoline 1-oxidoreductase subunit beta
MTTMLKMNRRSFLVSTGAAGTGLALGFQLPFGPDVVRAQDGSPEVNAWVVIRPDDTVVIRVARSEMGQGTLTGLAQLVAEELECDWSKVTTEFPTPGSNLARKRVWGDMSTGGSRGIRTSHQYVREGGAAARMMLVQAAASEWKVPVAECTAANSVITHTPSGRKTTYGKVAEAAAKLEPPKTEQIKLKEVKDWKVAGKPLKRLDTLEKLTGKMTYGIDIKLPGLLVATVRDAPVRGNKLKSFDAARVQNMPGVKKIVPVGDSGVAVIADTYWHAKKAIDALPVEWEVTENNKVSSATIAEFLKTGIEASEAAVDHNAGDALGAIKGAAKVFTQTYSYPYLNHATMEPMNTTALYTDDKCEVWCPTQNAEAALAAASEGCGLPITKCDVHKVFLGGGFGRRGRTDYVTQAVQIAKQMPGTPIKMLWSREEDMTHCSYHPVTQCKLTAGIDKDGNVVGLHMRIAGASISASLAPQNIQNGKDPITFQGLQQAGVEGQLGYNIPNVLIDYAMRQPHITAGFWRGVNVNPNAIYTECFIDELAHELKQDPVAFRLKLLKPKHAAVLKAVADKAGWGTPTPQGVFRGAAQFMGYGNYVAAIAEVSVSNDGVLKIHRIVGGTDPGTAVNPAQIERQMMGSFVYGLSALIYGECTVKDGAIEQKNFDTYDVLRIRHMPQVETIVMPSGGFWAGIGEPTIAVAAPAVLNAIFAATGKRMRNIPLKNSGIRMV